MEMDGQIAKGGDHRKRSLAEGSQKVIGEEIIVYEKLPDSIGNLGVNWRTTFSVALKKKRIGKCFLQIEASCYEAICTQ